jgi:hypothetical protein
MAFKITNAKSLPTGASANDVGSAVAVFYANSSNTTTALFEKNANKTSGFWNGEVHESTLASDGSWSHGTILTPTDSKALDGFGNAIAVDEKFYDILVGNKYGAVYVFDSRGQQKQKITAGSASDGFGYSIAANNDYALVGAPHTSSDQGCVYWLKRDNVSRLWSISGDPITGGAKAGDLFGYSVAMSGINLYGATPTIIAGAPGVDSSNASSGYIRSLRLNSDKTALAGWDAVNVVDANPHGRLGFSMAIRYTGSKNETMLVVGAPGASTGSGRNVGAVHVFLRGSGSLSAGPKLTSAAGAGATDRFGAAVGVAGDYVFVGAPIRDSMGAIDVFQQGSSSSWPPVYTWLGPDPRVYYLGYSIALSYTGGTSATLISGAPILNTTNTGHVIAAKVSWA